MKRIHLFEFEDQQWFPAWLRDCMTRLLPVVHKVVGTNKVLPDLVLQVLDNLRTEKIIDLCSGNGGPMPDVIKKLSNNFQKEIRLTLTDLYPHKEAAARINSQNGSVRYITEPVDATNVRNELKGLRTMVGSFHHMSPDNARKILSSVANDRQGLLIFEISDNRFPTWLFWIVLPFNIVFCLLITPFARPLTAQQLVFTYLLPVIPICFAWDGAVSNARTYTLNDIDELLRSVENNNYSWQKGRIGNGMLFMMGSPTE